MKMRLIAIVVVIGFLMPSLLVQSACIGKEMDTVDNDDENDTFWWRFLQDGTSFPPTLLPAVPTIAPTPEPLPPGTTRPDGPPTSIPAVPTVEPSTQPPTTAAPIEAPVPITPAPIDEPPTPQPEAPTIVPTPFPGALIPPTPSPTQPSPAPSFGPNICDEVCIDVRQGSQTIQVVKPVEMLDNIADFYNYIPSQASFQGTGVIPTVIGTSQIMIHGNGAICELSLLVLHDARNNGKNGGIVNMTISGDLSNAIVLDDPPDVGTFRDSYEYNASADETNIQWQWGSCCTDGIADVVQLESIDDCVTVSNVMFERGINRWVYVQGPLTGDAAAGENDYIDLDALQTLEMCRADCSRFNG